MATKEGNVVERDLVPLNKTDVGIYAELASLTNSSQGLLQFLTKKGLTIGTNLHVIEIEEFDLSVTIEYNNKVETLSPKVAESLLVIV